MSEVNPRTDLQALNAQFNAKKAELAAQHRESILANTSRFFIEYQEVAKPPYTCTECGETLEYATAPIFGERVQYQREACACEREKDRIRREAEITARREMAERDRRQRMAYLRDHSGIIGKLARMRLDQIHATPVLHEAIARAQAFIDSDETSESLFISGPYGTGKTHIAASVGNAMLERQVTVRFEVGFELLERIRRSYDRPDEEGPDVCEALAQVPLLIYDDLGNERIPADDRGDWAREKLLRIFYWRDVRELPCVITSNYTYKELGQKINFALISRLKGMCGDAIVIPANTPDWRAKK